MSHAAAHVDPQPPTAFPEPGRYEVAQMITLLSATPDAIIRYTLDGSTPTLDSPAFDRYQLIPMQAFGQAAPPGRRTFHIRAATQVGDRLSEERVFDYELDPRGRDVYVSHEIAPGIRVIRDFDDDKMYLVKGSQRALLIDAGMGAGDLRGYVEQFTDGLPLDVMITHGHPDHIACMGQFQTDCDVYMHPADLPLVERFIGQMGYDIDLDRIKDLFEGHVFDLGDRQWTVYFVPGHSPGCLALLDEQARILIAGDVIGSNRATIVDALWMQFSDDSIDQYLSVLQGFRAKVAGKFDLTVGGHNDVPLVGEAYLDHLEEAAQQLVDRGFEALTPSPRPAGIWQTVSGDRLSDPNWAAINVARETCLSAPPEKIATLSQLQVTGGALSPAFSPSVSDYIVSLTTDAAGLTITPTATSRRISALRINGVDTPSRQPVLFMADALPELIRIEVVAPDGVTMRTYSLTMAR